MAASHRPAATATSRSGMSPALCSFSAVVGLILPEGLALGATTGLPAALRRSSAMGCEGTRIAIDPSPELARSETGQSGRRGTTVGLVAGGSAGVVDDS